MIRSHLQLFASGLTMQELMTRLEDDATYLIAGRTPRSGNDARAMGAEMLELLRRLKSSERSMLIAKAPK